MTTNHPFNKKWFELALQQYQHQHQHQQQQQQQQQQHQHQQQQQQIRWIGLNWMINWRVRKHHKRFDLDVRAVATA